MIGTITCECCGAEVDEDQIHICPICEQYVCNSCYNGRMCYSCEDKYEDW